MNRQPELSFLKSALLALLFAGIALAGILHHEIWLDEAHHWLLARDSHSVKELIRNCRYEGHPMLWNFMLYFLAHFTSGPIAMQVLNLLVVTTGVFLFLRFSPFSFPEKLLFIFSYFILFEYTVIARNYGLAFLMLVMVACFYKKRKTHFILFSALLAILAQAHFMSMILSAGIFALATYEFRSRKEFPKWYYAGLALFAVSVALVFFQSVPPEDHFIYTFNRDGLFSAIRIGKGMSGVWKGLFPVPDFFSHYPWNTNLFIHNSRWIGIVPAIAGWIIPFFLFGRDKKMIFFFYGCSAAIAGFIYFSPLVLSVRYCGFYFLLLIFSLWISEQRLTLRLSKRIFISLLVAQVIGSVYLFYTDYKRPFSNGKAVAEWLDKNTDPEKMVVIHNHFSGPAVSAYSHRKLYYDENNEVRTFCLWNTAPFMTSEKELLEKTSALLKEKGSLWLVLNAPLKEKSFPDFDTRPVIFFDNALVKSENYWIYDITLKWKDQKNIY